MDFLSLAGLGLQGIGSISSMFGGNAANNLARQTAALNFQEQRRANQANEALAREMLAMQKAGVVTPEGRSRFVEGEGFVTELNPVAQAIFNANQRDELYRNTVEAQTARDERAREANRRGDEGLVADALMEQFVKRRPQYTPDQISSAMRLDARDAINSQFDRVSEAAANQLIRTGQPLNGAGLGALAERRSEALRAAGGGGNRLQGLQLAQEMTNNAQGNLLNQYNLFAGRASGIRDPQFQPTNTGAALTGAVMNQSARAPQAFSLAMTANRPAQYNQPNIIDSTSLGLGSVGAALYGAGQYRDNMSFLNELMQNRTTESKKTTS